MRNRRIAKTLSHRYIAVTPARRRDNEKNMKRPDRAGAIAASRPAPAPPALKIPFVEFVALAAAMMAMTAMSIDIMLPALPDIGAALGVSTENDRQLIVILYMAGFAIGQLIYGPISDRVGRKPALMAGLAIFIVGSIAAVMSQSFAALLAARVVQGFGAASPRVVAVAVVRDLYSGRQMARVMSFAMMTFIIIPVFAPSVGQALMHFGDWRWTFYALLFMAAALAAWTAARLPETAAAAVEGAIPLTLPQSFKATVTNRQTMGYGAASGVIFGSLLAYVASAQQVFVGVFGMGDEFPIFFGAVASVMAAASFVNARLVGTLGMRRVSHTALVGFFASSIVLAAASELGLAGIAVFVVLMASAFFFFGLIAPNFNALAMEPQGGNAGMASSIVGSLSTAIGAVCGAVIGRAFDGSVTPLALGFAACAALAFAMLLAIEGHVGLFGRASLTKA